MSVPSKRPFDSVEAPDRQRFHARGSLEDVEVKIEAQHPYVKTTKILEMTVADELSFE